MKRHSERSSYISRTLSLICLLSLFAWSMTAQNFEPVERIASLDDLQQNNGVAVADFDQDYDLDIFIVAKQLDSDGNETTQSKLYRNDDNGRFTDVTAAAGLTDLYRDEEDPNVSFVGLDGAKFGAFWGDYNNDGYPDIFFTHLLRVQLFQNNGNGTFTEVTETARLVGQNDCFNTGAAWVDYDNDGYLDLFISDWNRCGGNTLYRNLGNGTFENVTAQTGVADTPSRASYTMFPFDFNQDGWMDLYVSNDLHEPNSLFINQNGNSFTEQAASYGVDSTLEDMGIAMGDVNNDGFFDLFTTGINENALLLNDGTNNFTEVSAAWGIGGTDWSWGCRFADYDMDTDEDIFIVNGYYLASNHQNVYFDNLRNTGVNSFQDASGASNLNYLGMSTEVADFDFDFDGDLDVFVTDAQTSSSFYENKVNNFNEVPNANWLEVFLEGTTSNRNAFGSTLIIETDQGDFVRYYNGIGFLSQSIKPVHVGLDQISQINELTITWPSGLVERYQNIPVNSFVKLTEGNGMEVLNITPSDKILGCTDPNSCNYDPMATANDGNCTYLSAATISGNTNSGFNQVETYTFGNDTPNPIRWSVDGGEILTGQFTRTIRVKWGLGVSGKVTAIEEGDVCNGLPTTLGVTLDITDRLENVSVARIWNETLLEAIRNDFARPTVHARNLFHTSIALYDAWAIYEERAQTYLLGKTVNGFTSELNDFDLGVPEDKEKHQAEAMSYAAYRLLQYRFADSPDEDDTFQLLETVMGQLGYDAGVTDVAYETGAPSALGNYIAQTIINYGQQDGSRETTGYDNGYYEPVNPPLILSSPENSEAIIDPNRWQPLTFESFVDQSGNLISGNTPGFLSPEWGNVMPFALKEEDRSIFQRDQGDYIVYHDPGAPPQLDMTSTTTESEQYQWNFSLVSIWSSHLDPSDGVLWDISPRSMGNIDIANYPSSFADYPDFYNEIDGGDIGNGRALNPSTGQAYPENRVPRGDFTRVLAEFWADGPDSETPPGHWFTILNTVSDHEALEKRFNGQGEILSDLEWDVKAYFILGGAMHDTAISAWGIKGWYDYIRPISAIRHMASLGQSTDPSLPNYDIAGIPLKEGFVELVADGDPLSGNGNVNVGKVKVYAWRGHSAIQNTEEDTAGVGWILAEDWFPYQRPSFVTPPFAGYVSGHSTYSRAAAEVLTLITGDEYFPGGVGEFLARKNEFLVFEEGPSVDVMLQWATYRDASDQTSLSRIWGGIHPPADDILGRIIGVQIGIDAFEYAVPYFTGQNAATIDNSMRPVIYPNPTSDGQFNIANVLESASIELFDINGRKMALEVANYNEDTTTMTMRLTHKATNGLYLVRVDDESMWLMVFAR